MHVYITEAESSAGMEKEDVKRGDITVGGSDKENSVRTEMVFPPSHTADIINQDFT